MKEKEKKALLRVRAQVRIVRELGERLKALDPEAAHGAPMDGMPRARGGLPGGLDTLIARRDSLKRIIERESELMRRYDDEARKSLDQMRPDLYTFCVLYYLGGLDIDEVAQALERSERQCMRYRKEIETEDGKRKRTVPVDDAK